jgi:two-component system, NtrC family, sensor kinase
MKKLNSEKVILNIIRFGAVTITLIFSILITCIVLKEEDKILEKQINILKQEILNEKRSDIKNESNRVISSTNNEIDNSKKHLNNIYPHNFEEKLQKIQNELEDAYKDIFQDILMLSIVLTLILMMISFYISIIITKMFSKYKKDLQKEINNTIEKERLLIRQSKMATMGEMIANIAHQWKQPLSIISTVSTGIKIQKELNSLDENEIVEGMNNINNSVQYLSQTIDDFRNFFKSDKTKISFKFLDIYENTIKIISPQFKCNNIKLIKKIDDNEIYGYRNELLQVLINIFKNAKDELIKLNQNQKRFIFIDGYKENSNYIIKIKDNAGGISPDIIEKIFEPYFTTKEELEGTGIGLYMSKQIIKGMRGIIKIRNAEYEYEGEKYKGAEFIISLQLNLE